MSAPENATSERCNNCHHEKRYHVSHMNRNRGEMVPCCETNHGGPCRCETFVASGVFNCDDYIRGDYRTPNGANQNRPCYGTATFVADYEGREWHVCGRHVKRCTGATSVTKIAVPA